MFVFPDVKCGDSDFSKFKIVRAIDAAFLRSGIRNGDATLCLRPQREGIIQCRHAETRVFYVARLAPDIHTVDVDVSQSLCQRVERMERVVFGSEQTGFFRSRG